MTLQIRPLRTHVPGYPRFVEVEDWRALLEPSSKRVFGPRVLLFAGLLGSSLLIPVAAHAAPLKAQNAEAVQIATAALDDVHKGFWSEKSTYGNLAFVPGNPELTVPQIPVSFGNSYTGVIDAVRTRKITRELFAAYGVKLVEDHPLERQGIQFTADGWDPDKHIGFELLETPAGGGEVSEQEFERMKREIANNEMSIFLASPSAYPIMDQDEFPSTRAYLQSVLDYLDWLKTQGRL